MKITRTRTRKTDLPRAGETDEWGARNAIAAARASDAVIDTDAGFSGCGEVSTCGEKAIADANQGGRVDNKTHMARATRDLDYILEQPCRNYEECQQVRRIAQQPMKLNECVTRMRSAQCIIADHGAEVCCLKISYPAELSKARRVRNFLTDNRIPMVAEDTCGGEATTAAVAHFAASTPTEYLQKTTALHICYTRSTGKPAAASADGCLTAPDTSGLGLAQDFGSLGACVAEYSA